MAGAEDELSVPLDTLTCGNSKSHTPIRSSFLDPFSLHHSGLETVVATVCIFQCHPDAGLWTLVNTRMHSLLCGPRAVENPVGTGRCLVSFLAHDGI